MTQPQTSQAVYANMMRSNIQKEQIMSAINSIVDETQHIDEMTFRLTGFKYKKAEGQLKKEVYHKPLLSESGAQEIMSYYSGFLSKNIILSWYDQQMIKVLCKQFDRGLLNELVVNVLKYGINTEVNIIKIWRLLSVNHQAVLNRALRGMTLINSLQNISMHEVRQFDEDKGKEKKGLFRRFNLK